MSQKVEMYMEGGPFSDWVIKIPRHELSEITDNHDVAYYAICLKDQLYKSIKPVCMAFGTEFLVFEHLVRVSPVSVA